MPTAGSLRPTRRPAALVAVLGLVGLALTALLGVGPAGAESPTVMADEVAEDGVFVAAFRNDVDEAALIAAVEDARNNGLDLVVIVPGDPQPTAKAFARRVQELTEVDAVVVLPSDGPLEAYVMEDLSTARPRAVDAARTLADPARAVATFAEELTTVAETGRPAIVGQILRALLLFAVVIGAVIGVENFLVKPRRTASAAS